MEHDLYVSCTPLQGRISEKIKNLNANNSDINSTMVFLRPKVNKIQAFAKLRMDKEFNNVFDVPYLAHKIRAFSFINILLVCFILLVKFRGRSFSKVYVASVDSLPIQLLLSIITFKEIYTYDDGSANINKGSSYYVFNNEHLLLSLIRKLFRINLNKEDLIKLSSLHYSIYKGSNIVSPVQYIGDDFFKIENELRRDDVSASAIIMLGTVYKDNNVDKVLLRKFIESRYGAIDYYLPHPRENNHLFPDKKLNDYRVAEDKLLGLLSDYSELKVITFPSSVVLNLSHIPSLHFDLLYTGKLTQSITECYDFECVSFVKIY
ncbi:glycosyltransferase family 52 [Vibrio gigantis]|uniref:glycosyltransferase family 52 n=1 Tax=Vibrio gigantis TaxID=296199 RepID=UPI001BFE4A5D|nr:glycosyltransferase family 52 [Vibrio gigantis]